MKNKTNKKKFNKKKLLTFGMLSIFALALVSAGLVNYLSNTIQTDVTVESPFTIDEEMGLDLDVNYSANDDFSLIKITNNADRDITANVEISVNPGEFGYNNNDGGIGIAISDDINYCFNSQGEMTGVNDNCEANYMKWMENNVDWNDWYANEGYDDEVFFSDLVVNTDNDSFHSVGYSENKFILPGVNFPAGETVYGVVYITTNPALEPNTYNFDMTIVPSA